MPALKGCEGIRMVITDMHETSTPPPPPRHISPYLHRSPKGEGLGLGLLHGLLRAHSSRLCLAHLAQQKARHGPPIREGRVGASAGSASWRLLLLPLPSLVVVVVVVRLSLLVVLLLLYVLLLLVVLHMLLLTT